MSGFQGQSSDADIDIGQLFAAIWRDKLRILTGALIVTVLTFVALSLVSPKYTAETKLLIDANESVFTRPSNENQQVDRSNQVDLESVASQVEVITSTSPSGPGSYPRPARGSRNCARWIPMTAAPS